MSYREGYNAAVTDGRPTVCAHCGTVTAALTADTAPRPAGCDCACHLWRAELARVVAENRAKGKS